MNKITCFIPLLLVLLASSCSSPKSPPEAIEEVLHQYNKINVLAQRERGGPTEQAIYIARECQKIDLSKCPSEFRVAFRDYINAMETAAPHFKGTLGKRPDPNHASQNEQAAYSNICDAIQRLKTAATMFGADPGSL